MNKIILLSIISISSLVAMNNNPKKDSKSEPIIRFLSKQAILAEVTTHDSREVLKQIGILDQVANRMFTLSRVSELIDDRIESYRSRPEKQIPFNSKQFIEAKKDLLKVAKPDSYQLVNPNKYAKL
jgi:hypothetical protein